MRTTVNIQDALLEEAKNVAHHKNCSLGKVIEEALQASFTKESQAKPAISVELPTFGGKGTMPGINLDSTSDLLDTMEEA